MHSYSEKDLNDSVSLYGDKEVVTYFDSGKPRTFKEAYDIVNDIGLKQF